MLRDGRKSEAINYVRDRFEVSVPDATRLVEAVEIGMVSPSNNNDRGPLPELSRHTAKCGKMYCSTTILVLVTVMCITLAGWLYYRQYKAISGSTLVPGVVVQLEESSDSEAVAPVVEYTWNGKTMRYQSSTYSHPPAYELRESVRLYVNRDDPETIYIDSFTERWLAVVILGVVGAITGSIATIFYRAGRRH